jgi:hypothetical protein
MVGAFVLKTHIAMGINLNHGKRFRLSLLVILYYSRGDSVFTPDGDDKFIIGNYWFPAGDNLEI